MIAFTSHRYPLAGPDVVPSRGTLPVLLSIPHSGRDYPKWLLDLTRCGRASLSPLEDPLVDRLAWRALGLGVGAVIARAPRAAIDCNRAPSELDTSVVAAVSPDRDPGPRARAGLGIVPGRTPQHGELWRRKVSRSEYASRLVQAHETYHAALDEALRSLRHIHGEVLLLDCHSMPPRNPGQSLVVLGDRHGTSCGRWLADLAAATIEQDDLSASFNDPYAGGWIVERHGRPEEGIHALQLELDRSLYLDERLTGAGAGFDRMAGLLAALVRTLGQALLDRSPLAVAAE